MVLSRNYVRNIDMKVSFRNIGWGEVLRGEHRLRRAVPPRARREILRLREHVSQAVFARYLNVTTGPASQWERGEKRPRGAALKLLTLVVKNGLAAVA